MTLILADEAEPIHSAIIRKEAWTLDPVRRLRAAADKRLKEGPWSVTPERPQGVDIDPHDYYSQAPYWWPNLEDPSGPYIRRDGHTNPDRFLANKNALSSMCDAVFSLGTAAYLLDDPRYAKRAAMVINVWFVNPKTRMNPNLEYAQSIPGVNDGRGAGILDGRVFIRAVQGMEFLALTGSWDAKDQAAVHRWFLEYLRWLATSKQGEDEKSSGNNHASWWTAQAAAVASYLEDKPAETAIFQHYRDQIVAKQIRANGSAPREESRTRSLSYSAFNAEAYVMTCRIAQVQSADLWNVRAPNGASLATVIGYLAPFFQDPKRWSKDQIIEFDSDGLYLLAFAAMGLKKPEYAALYHELERPEGAWLSFVDLLLARWEDAAHQTRH